MKLMMYTISTFVVGGTVQQKLNSFGDSTAKDIYPTQLS